MTRLTRLRLAWAAWNCALPILFGAALSHAALAAEGVQPLAALQQQADIWLRQGFDDAQATLDALDIALATPGLEPAHARILQRTRGAVAARAGRDVDVDAALKALDALAVAGDALARPDAALVRALRDEQLGHSARAVTQAREAADSYAAVCTLGVALRPDCDLRAQWLAQQTLLLREREDVDLNSAIARGDEAVALARRAGDPALQAWTLATQASLWAGQGDVTRARRAMSQAEALLREVARPDVETRVALLRARVADAAGDAARVDRALRAAFDAARRARSPRLVAAVQVNQSDVLVRRGRAREALAAVQAALPVVRKVADRRLERILLHNGALAQIALGRSREAKVQAQRLFELWAADGTLGEQSVALREVADALAGAGDARAALDLYHRERDVTSRVMAEQREAAERSARARYDRDAQQRNIELIARDNTIQATELHNRNLVQRLWALAAVVVGLAALLVGLLLRRVWATQGALQRSQAQLKVQSERDPLTGAANRRHGQARLQAESEAADGAWSGALLLVDVDHFKHVNDEYGHNVGDEVLVEVARRLQSAVREHDVVVRWGGEEFLVMAPKATGASLDALAQRLMRCVSETPVPLADGRTIAVTVSVGYGAFPLSPRQEHIRWDRALNLADMALYTAKSQGRNRAVGISGLHAAADAATMERVEADFERAWQDGVLNLAIQPGS
jgi:diguanylate cyclase (GGDEF)-like protein